MKEDPPGVGARAEHTEGQVAPAAVPPPRAAVTRPGGGSLAGCAARPKTGPGLRLAGPRLSRRSSVLWGP